MAAEKGKPHKDILARDLRARTGAGESAEQGTLDAPGAGKPPPPRVLVIAADRRFREVTALLLARRGCVVTAIASGGSLVQSVERDRPEVVVVDASASRAFATRCVAALGALDPAPAVVIVAEQDGVGNGVAGLPSVPKWGPFGLLYDAIERSVAERVGRISARRA